MVDRQQEIIKYETSKHHRQNLRSEIDSQLIDGIQKSSNPSANYYQAYKGLYRDDYQKSVSLHGNKRDVELLKNTYEKQDSMANSRINAKQNSGFEPTKSNVSLSIHSPQSPKNYNYRDVQYQDYFLKKETRALDHTMKNYDGGMKFYEDNNRYHQHQKRMQEDLRKTLQKQLCGKLQKQEHDKNKRSSQIESMQMKDSLDQEYDHMLKQNQKNKSKHHYQALKKQMMEKQSVRNNKSYFQYDHQIKNNPITNPIQFRIENPYILRQIQNNLRQQASQ